MLTIKKSSINGKGVFTSKEIKKGKRVFTFANRIILINHKPGCHCKICCRCIQIKGNQWLYPYKNSYGWYLNHSCNPDCYPKGKFIYSLKKIKPHSEITIDYALTNTDTKWKMICHCKSKHCREIIRSKQYLPKNY